MATSINTDTIIDTVNAFIPVIIVFALLGSIMRSFNTVKF